MMRTLTLAIVTLLASAVMAATQADSGTAPTTGTETGAATTTGTDTGKMEGEKAMGHKKMDHKKMAKADDTCTGKKGAELKKCKKEMMKKHE